MGSGIVYKTDGTIVTNAHVVEGAREVSVAFADGQQVSANVRAVDRVTDVAVLQADRTDLTAATFETALPEVGALAVVVGSPLGFEATVTSGIISGLHRQIPGSASWSATSRHSPRGWRSPEPPHPPTGECRPDSSPRPALVRRSAHPRSYAARSLYPGRRIQPCGHHVLPGGRHPVAVSPEPCAGPSVVTHHMGGDVPGGPAWAGGGRVPAVLRAAQETIGEVLRHARVQTGMGDPIPTPYVNRTSPNLCW
ncbi:serine protease [Rhodococcus opacus RKJ300 = JCM 13270]|uniref:Serine protease n=1 Tax=Rhodococcus opacus RKJ300 = JCM 13270 TaxID=1165867 RepID=I0WZH6_RHOOP|nr:serine protease [Rhodococcus opacus RKJ300 = JCM 13270]